MKQVLLIANLDANSPDTLRYAAEFCKHHECKLHILSIDEDNDPVLVSSPHYYNKLGFQINLEKADRSHHLAKRLMDFTGDYISNEWVKVDIEVGNKEQVITDFISKHFIDLIIVGDKIFKQISEEEDIKSILANVVTVPLLIIPKFEVFKAFKALNYLTQYSEKDIKHLKKITSIFIKASITLTHFTHEQKDADGYTKAGTKWYKYLNQNINKKMKLEEIDDDISKYLETENHAITKVYDGIIMTTHNRSFWRRLIDPSTTLSLISDIEIPVLVFKYIKTD